MNSIFASASALLATGFVEKFASEHLELILGRLDKETGVKVDRSSDSLLITGKWTWILESHDILLEEYRNLTEFRNDNTVEPSSDMAEEDNEHAKMSDDSSEQIAASGQYKATNEIVSDYMRLMSEQFKLTSTQNGAEENNITDDLGTKMNVEQNDIKVENGTYTKLQDYDDGDDTDDYMDSTKTDKISPKQLKSKVRKSRKPIKRKALRNSTENTFPLSNTIKVEPNMYEEEGFLFGNEMAQAVTAGSLIAKASLGVDNNSENLQCLECTFVGKNKSSLSAHTKRCHLKKFHCPHCTSSFGFNKDLKRHIMKAHDGVETPDDSVDRSANVVKRGRKKRPKINDPSEVFPCDQCSYVGKKVLLREHKRRLHSIKFDCDICNKSFGYNKDLNRHKRTVHCEPEYQCLECNKFFKTPRLLNTHSLVHKEDKESFTCQVCDKSYSTKYVLDYHIKSEHMGMKKSFKCPICGRSFTQKSSYRQHANVHAGIRPYICDVCGKSFSYENGLKAHKFLHNDVRQFQCQICDKKFLHKNSLRIHGNVHKESHDHMCTTCGQKFTQKQSLIRHERIHTGAKPYLCTICQKSFRDASIIRRHMILTHKKDPKKWQEDMVNNTMRSENFYVTVLGIGNDLPPEVQEENIYKDFDIPKLSDETLDSKQIYSNDDDDGKSALLTDSMGSLQPDMVTSMHNDSNNVECTKTQNLLKDSAAASLQNMSNNLELNDTQNLTQFTD